MTDIDLDAIEARRSAALAADHGQFYDAAVILADDVPALVAEVRRLREHATHDAEVEQALTADLDDARAAIARVRALDPADHATSSRDYGRGYAQALRDSLRALDGDA